jgi:hypothetical protein
MIQAHYTTLTGSKIGVDKRKQQFLKTNGFTNPGPGSYKSITFVDKNSAPRFGFGTSAREKDYMKLKKIQLNTGPPGPGHYKIPVHVGKIAPFNLARTEKQSYV